jgi:hypothetical protein
MQVKGLDMGMCICTCTCVGTSAHFPPMSFSLVTNAMLQKANGTTTFLLKVVVVVSAPSRKVAVGVNERRICGWVDMMT